MRIGPHIGIPGGGEVPFSPPSLPGCTLWLRADRGVTPAGGPVTTWADQSGTGRDVAAPAGINEPTFLAAGGPLGTPCLRFDGVNDYLRGAWVQAQPVHMFVVGIISRAGATETLLDGVGGANTRRIYGDAAGPNVNLHCGVALANPGVVFNNTWLRIAIECNGATSSNRIGDAVPVTGNAGASTTGGITLGNNGALSNAGDCDIAEVIEYSRILSAGEAAVVGAYLKGRYGI